MSNNPEKAPMPEKPAVETAPYAPISGFASDELANVSGSGAVSTGPATDSAPDYATFPRKFVSYRWFKPLLVALLTVVFMLIFEAAVMLSAIIWSGNINFLNTVGTSYDDMDVFSGPGALFELGAIAVFLPALALAALIVRDRPFSSYSSSRGGFKWSAFAKCAGIVLAIYAIDFILEAALIPGEPLRVEILFSIDGLLMCIVLIPLQSFAEEYIFRGLVLQAVASWTKLPIAGIAVSAILFTIGHGYNDIGMIAIFINGIVWGVIVWKTKGLEATCALHAINNMSAFLMSGFGLVATTSQVDIMSLVISVGIDLVYLGAVLFANHKLGWFTPKGDGYSEFNRKKLAKQARKQPAPPESENQPEQ